MAEGAGSYFTALTQRSVTAFLDNTSDLMYVVDEDLVCRSASLSFARFLGLHSADEIVGKTIYQFIPDASQAQRYAHDSRQVLQSGRDILNFTEALTDHEGKLRHALCSKLAVRGEDGRPAGVLYISKDVTREMEANEDYLNAIKLHMTLKERDYGTVLLDLSIGRVLQVNINHALVGDVQLPDDIDAFLSMSRDTANGDPAVCALVDQFDLADMRARYKAGRRFLKFEYFRTMSDGEKRYVRMTLRLEAEPVSGHLMGIVTLSDIDDVKKSQEALKIAAQIDSMTRLLNHDATLSHIEAFLTGEGKDGSHALFMVDRDNLKGVNDNLGHQAGDDIIIETANVLKNAFRDDDIIGRIGGDEFLVLVKNAGKPQSVRRKAGELLQSLQYICRTPELTVESTGSIGISFYRGDGKTTDKLYAEADAALYQSKAAGRNRYTVYNTETSGVPEKAAADTLLESVNLRTLLNSIDGGILLLHAQDGKELSPVFFSDSFLTILGGLSSEEALRLSAGGFFPCVHPDDRTRVKEEYKAALMGNGNLRTTYRLIGKDGIYHWLSVGMNIIKYDDKVDAYAVHTNIESLMDKEQKLASNEQRYRMAFAQTSRLLFEYDIPKGELTFYLNNASGPSETIVTGLPDSLIQSGTIHADSADAFRAFYEQMLTGKARDKGLFKSRYITTGEIGWITLSYQSILEEGKPKKAIGSAEELPGIAGRQNKLEREIFLMQALKDDLLFAARAELNSDCVLYTCAPNDAHAELIGESYAAMLSELADSAANKEDATLLRLQLSSAALRESFSRGTGWVCAEYRRNEGGQIRWTRLGASLIEDPVKQTLNVFWYLTDAEARRSLEEILPVVPEREASTHLYSMQTFETLVNSLLRYGGASTRLYALAVIRVQRIAELITAYGAENIEAEITFLGRYLGALLDRDCILGSYSGDGFLVFCADAKSDAQMRDKIEHALASLRALRAVRDNAESFSLVCGISTERAASAELSGMISQAVRICDAYVNAEEDHVGTFDDYVDAFRLSEDSLRAVTYSAIEAESLERPLLGAERAAMLECLQAMLAADDYDTSVKEAMGVLGRFYEAQRVYTLTLVSGGAAVTCQSEWTAPGKHSIMRQTSGVSVEKMPMIKRVLTVGKPILMNNKGMSRLAVLNNGVEKAWCFIILPFFAEKKVQGFLCIENPAVRVMDAALPYALLPILMHERMRFGVMGPGMGVAGRDDLTGLPDRVAYNSAMQSFNPDACHSIGAVCVNIVNLYEVNRSQGVAYGDNMLVFTAQTLQDIFRKDKVFRLTGGLFAVLCVNAAQEAFQGQYMRAQSILQRRFPKSFAFGQSWSDKPESARVLMSHAEKLSQAAAKPGARRTAEKQATMETDALIDLKTALAENRFFILLQPQVDMRSRQVVCAEALARYRNRDGLTVLPAEFIQALEDSGGIRELDFFVLDRAFAAVQQWHDLGYEPIPISVNLSRKTLLAPTTLASLLAIQSRYDVPPHCVELEVTETEDREEMERLHEALSRIREQAFRFSLDDLKAESKGLMRLGEMEFDTVKLDKSLVTSFLFNATSKALVESILSQCQRSGVRCVAEGVQGEAQIKALMDAGCNFAQGYYYGKPMPAEEFTARYLKKTSGGKNDGED